MFHLLYVNPLHQDIISIVTPSNITVQISKEVDESGEYRYFWLYFSGLNTKGQNNFVFSIYKKHDQISEENKDLFIDKDSIYIYEQKEKAYKIDYNFIEGLFKTQKLRFIDGKKTLFMPFKTFYNEHLLYQEPNNVLELAKDINFVKNCNDEIRRKNYPDTIKKEIASPIIGR